MTASDVDDAWMEVALVEIMRIGDTEALKMAAITETIDFDPGEKGIEGIVLVNGGRVTMFNPEGDSTITLEGYPLQAGTIDSTTTGTGFSDLVHSQDTTAPMRILNDHNRDKLRVLVMWTNDSTATTASSITAANASALRIGLVSAYCTKVAYAFTDGKVKVTVTLKCAAFQKDVSPNVLVESCAGESSDLLPAIAAYTTSADFA